MTTDSVSRRNGDVWPAKLLAGSLDGRRDRCRATDVCGNDVHAAVRLRSDRLGDRFASLLAAGSE